MRRNIAFIFFLVFTAVLSGCQQIPVEIPYTSEAPAAVTENPVESGSLTVHYIDVGQGDAALIQQGEAAMLIDAGENSCGDEVAAYIESLGIERLDYVIGTHPHSDHIGGLDDVIDSFDIGQVIMPRVSHTTKTYEDVLVSVKNKGLTVTGAKAGQVYGLGTAQAEILSPLKDSYEDLNEYSVVLRLTFGNNTFLFTGDMESYNEKELLNAGADVSADVLKVAHHGSYTSSTEAFIEAAGAKYAVISVGSGNNYGHPHTSVTRRLNRLIGEIYRTDLQGTVIITSDGNNITVDTEREAVT